MPADHGLNHTEIQQLIIFVFQEFSMNKCGTQTITKLYLYSSLRCISFFHIKYWLCPIGTDRYLPRFTNLSSLRAVYMSIHNDS